MKKRTGFLEPSRYLCGSQDDADVNAASKLIGICQTWTCSNCYASLNADEALPSEQFVCIFPLVYSFLLESLWIFGVALEYFSGDNGFKQIYLHADRAKLGHVVRGRATIFVRQTT